MTDNTNQKLSEIALLDTEECVDHKKGNFKKTMIICISIFAFVIVMIIGLSCTLICMENNKTTQTMPQTNQNINNNNDNNGNNNNNANQSEPEVDNSQNNIIPENEIPSADESSEHDLNTSKTVNLETEERTFEVSEEAETSPKKAKIETEETNRSLYEPVETGDITVETVEDQTYVVDDITGSPFETPYYTENNFESTKLDDLVIDGSVAQNDTVEKEDSNPEFKLTLDESEMDNTQETVEQPVENVSKVTKRKVKVPQTPTRRSARVANRTVAKEKTEVEEEKPKKTQKRKLEVSPRPPIRRSPRRRN